MLRLIGGLLIVGVSVWLGWYLSHRLTRRRQVLGAYIGLLQEAANRIGYTSQSLADVFCDNFAGFVFDPGAPFAPQWQRMIGAYCDILSREDQKVLSDFARALGHGDVSAELSRIRLYQTLLQERLDDAKDACQKKGAVYRVLPFSVGMVLILFLL